MRTRFHSPPFFNNPNAASSSSSTFQLLPLPPPPHTLPPTFSLTETLLCSLNVADALLTDLAIPAIPIQSALSRFYSEAVPHFIDHLPTTPFTDQISMAVEDWAMDNVPTFETESNAEQKSSLKFDCDKHEPNLEVLQFEVPQPHTLTANAYNFREILHALPEASEVDVLLDETKFQLHIPYLSQKSVYSVDNIQLVYHPHEESRSSDHDGHVHNTSHQCAFPHFEVDDMILEISFGPAIGNELVSLFRCMELECQNQGDQIASNFEELLPSTDVSLVDTIQIELENFDTVGTDFVLEKDFICMKENYRHEPSACSLEKSDGYYYISHEPVVFQEIQFFEFHSSPTTDVFLEYTRAGNPLNLGSLLRENLVFPTFDELIVSYELVLADDMFRSLPVPIITDCDATVLMRDSIWKVLAELKPQPLSVSSDIYLDWHLLEDHKLNDDTNSACEKLMNDLNHHPSEVEFSVYDKDMSILSLISEDTAISSANEECKVSLSLVSGSFRSPLSTVPKMDVVKGLPRIPMFSNGGAEEPKYADMETILTKSVPQFNDLEFFLNPQEATSGTKRISRVEQHDSNVDGRTDNSSDVILDSVPVKQIHHWDVRIHHVRLSDSIATLISYFQKCYLAIFESITLLRTTPLFPHGDKSKLLRYTKQELVNEIGSLIALSSGCRDENILALLTLCAIKQMSWYLCFYGIHATQAYVHNLCSATDFFRLRLCFLQSLISDALIQTDEDITRSHPSLGKISEILSSKPSDGETKILIVVEQVLWHPLKLLLSSIGLSVKEIQNHQWPSHHQDPSSSSTSSTAVTDILLNVDCLIVSHKSVSGVFPFHKFALILEYGGSHCSSRLKCIPQTSIGLPPLKFLKMELEPLGMLKVFCENSELPFSLGDALEGQVTSILQTHGSINLQKLGQVLNCVPDSDETTVSPSIAKVAEACTVSSSIISGANDMHNHTIPIQAHHCPFIAQNPQGLSSCPEQLVIMNTQNLIKEMIVSRRSTYQKLLSLEKERVQVVERDSSLPADIIVTASICLVWYESKNLFSIADQTKDSSCLSSCIEHIATNVLLQLSFAFTSCYLVFEGNHSFTSSISEYADGLYAAAASLGIDIQLLYSHSSESTGEIILNCIRFARKFTKNLYPPMPDSETFAECLLTKFPSINPLSAHAIICSGNSLIEFFLMPRKVRLQVMKKYYVPEVSINLFSVLCKFGEREDTRSGTTDCSSSVSSAPESEYFQCKLRLEDKKRKFSSSPSRDGTVVEKSLQYEHSNTSTYAGLIPPRVADQFLSRLSDDPKVSSCSDTRWFGSQGEGRLCEDKLKSAYTGETVIGEADFDATFYLDNSFFPLEKSRTHSPLHGKRKAPEQKNPGIARRLSFDAISDPTFSMVDFDLCPKKNNRDYEYEGTETHDIDHFTDIGSYGTLSRVGHVDLEQRCEPKAKRYHPPIYQEADKSPYGGNPLRNAIDSFKLQQGSPWTIEFLNRVREKSRAHQKSSSCGTFPPNFGHSGNKRHTTKRKSPSIIDLYRYQGGSSAQKTIERTTRLQGKEPLGSIEREDASASRTPVDKRARKALSFIVSKHGSQSKLVWLDGSI